MRILKFGKKRYMVKKLYHKKGNDLLELVEFDKKKYNDLINDIVEKVYGLIDRRAVVKEGLALLNYDDLLNIQKKLKQGVKPKKEKGCYLIKVGNEYIPIVG